MRMAERFPKSAFTEMPRRRGTEKEEGREGERERERERERDREIEMYLDLASGFT